MSEHSRVPWGTDVTRTLIFSGKKIIADTYDSDTVLTDRETAQANAEYIVRACNEYHDLIDQRKDLVDAGNNVLGVFVGYVEGSIGGQAIKQLETAIAKTKEN